ncbi:hypothetical protein F5146DRAFT_999398 [Armillaria mellea]|nr:hypothetical protein F5146DRAFT_999398 [Armillaria mellea]
MRGRISSNPVDQVGGLAFLLVSRVIPAYHAAQSADDAWATLVATMDPWHRAILFFLYPAPGYRDRITQWWPSWDQVMSDSISLPSTDGIWVAARVRRDGDGSIDTLRCSCIESGYLQGLAQGESEIPSTLEVAATHQWPIPDGFYALVGTPNYSEFWVVGQFTNGRFSKVSVVRLAVEGTREQIQKLYRGQKDFTLCWDTVTSLAFAGTYVVEFDSPSERQSITVDLGLDGDLDLEVEVKAELHGCCLSAEDRGGLGREVRVKLWVVIFMHVPSAKLASEMAVGESAHSLAENETDAGERGDYRLPETGDGEDISMSTQAICRSHCILVPAIRHRFPDERTRRSMRVPDEVKWLQINPGDELWLLGRGDFILEMVVYSEHTNIPTSYEYGI